MTPNPMCATPSYLLKINADQRRTQAREACVPSRIGTRWAGDLAPHDGE